MVMTDSDSADDNDGDANESGAHAAAYEKIILLPNVVAFCTFAAHAYNILSFWFS